MHYLPQREPEIFATPLPKELVDGPRGQVVYFCFLPWLVAKMHNIPRLNQPRENFVEECAIMDSDRDDDDQKFSATKPFGVSFWPSFVDRMLQIATTLCSHAYRNNMMKHGQGNSNSLPQSRSVTSLISMLTPMSQNECIKCTGVKKLHATVELILRA